MEARFYKRLSLGLALVIIFMALSGCAGTPSVSGYGGARYYWRTDVEECAMTREDIAIYLDTLIYNVYSWRNFQKVAFSFGFSGSNTKAFTHNGIIELEYGYDLGTLHHEIAHNKGYSMGIVGHEPQCWATYKPYGYDNEVLNLFEGLELP